MKTKNKKEDKVSRVIYKTMKEVYSDQILPESLKDKIELEFNDKTMTITLKLSKRGKKKCQ